MYPLFLSKALKRICLSTEYWELLLHYEMNSLFSPFQSPENIWQIVQKKKNEKISKMFHLTITGMKWHKIEDELQHDNQPLEIISFHPRLKALRSYHVTHGEDTHFKQVKLYIKASSFLWIFTHNIPALVGTHPVINSLFSQLKQSGYSESNNFVIIE